MQAMSIAEFATHNHEPEWLQVKRQVVSRLLKQLPMDAAQSQYQFAAPRLIAKTLKPNNWAAGTLKQNGGIIMDLFAAANCYPNFVQENLMEKAIEWRENALNARHLAYLQSGGFVYIPPNTIINAPIDLSKLIDYQQQEKHLLVVVGANAKVHFTLIDQQTDLQNDCLMVELLLGCHASVQYFDEVHTNSKQHHRILNAYLAQNAKLTTAVGLLNHGDLRYESHLNLDGQGSQGQINFVSVATNDQHQSIHTSIDEYGPNTHGEINGYGFIDASAIIDHFSNGTIQATSFNSDFQQHNRLIVIGNHGFGRIIPRLKIANAESKHTQSNQVVPIEGQQLSDLQSLVDHFFANRLNDKTMTWIKQHVLRHIMI